VFDWVDLAFFLLTGTSVGMVGLAFNALPLETKQRWKPRIAVIFGTVAVLALLQWVWLFLSYRP
jgi:multisubunit Na+/H+ antiporter MnhB subunit